MFCAFDENKCRLHDVMSSWWKKLAVKCPMAIKYPSVKLPDPA